MDPLTQGLLGATASTALFSRQLGRWAATIGLVAGAAADADVAFSFVTDPLNAVLLHRHFTHALIFIPLGGFVAAMPFLWIRSLRHRRRQILMASVLAYATHAPLDACTSYGTPLFWPFDMTRVAFDFISIIDPVFTLILLIGVLWATAARKVQPARVALIGAGLYMAIAAVQHQRALDSQFVVIKGRYQDAEHRRVIPTLGNIVLWRSLYASKNMARVDAIRVPLIGGQVSVREGDGFRIVDERNLPEGTTPDSRLWRQFNQYRWFADDWLARPDLKSHLIGDMRYSAAAHSLQPLWGIQINPEDMDHPVQHVNLTGKDDRRPAIRELWSILLHGDPAGRPLSDFLKNLR